MSLRRFTSPFIKLLVLIALVAWLLHFRTTHQPPPAPVGGGDNDEDDVQYAPVVPVSVAPVIQTTLRGYVVAYGNVEPEPATKDHPAASASITVPASALVADVSCIEGQYVEKGQPLFTLDARYAEAALDRARRALAAADEDVDRLTHSTDSASGPNQQWLSRARRDQDRARADLNDAAAHQAVLTLVSPLSGTVMQLQVHPGEIATPAVPAVVVADTDRLVVAVSVPAAELASLKVGQPAQIVQSDESALMNRSTTQPQTQPQNESQSQPAMIEGSVLWIDPGVDPKTGFGSVDVSIPSGSSLRIGDFKTVRIVTAEHRNCLAVPATSIVRDVDGIPGISVAVREFQWAFRHRVKVGLTDHGLVEVESEGLKAGDPVVTTGAYALPDQSRIRLTR